MKGLAINRFDGPGIRIAGGGGHAVQGNFIGTDIGGTADLTGIAGTFADGVRVEDSAANTIGGGTAAARNVISGNGSDGVEIAGAASTGNAVHGNHIGTTKSGSVALGNDGIGVHVFGADGSAIGGTAPGERNVISGNRDNGAFVSEPGTLVQGNFVGTNAAGTAAVANGASGLLMFGNFSTVGGTVPAARTSSPATEGTA